MRIAPHLDQRRLGPYALQLEEDVVVGDFQGRARAPMRSTQPL